MIDKKITAEIAEQVWITKENLAKSVIPNSLWPLEKRRELMVFIATHEIHWRNYPLLYDGEFLCHEFLWKDGALIAEVYVRIAGNTFQVLTNPTLPY